MSGALIVNAIPVPSDPAIKQAYLDLGWYELSDGPVAARRLKWPTGKGAPLHPGERYVLPSDYGDLLSSLERGLLERLAVNLPNPTGCNADMVVHAVLAVVFQAEAHKRRRKFAETYFVWEPTEASLVVIDYTAQPED